MSVVLLLILVPHMISGDGPLATRVIACVVVSLMYAAPIAIVTGLLRGTWRMVGAWLFLPLVLVPATVMLAFWLGSGWLASEARTVVVELVASAEKQGFANTLNAAPAMRMAHAGAPGAVIALVILLPFFISDVFWILIDFDFLLSLVRFLLSVVFIALLGALPSLAVSGTVLGVAFVKRLRHRYRASAGS